jgi:hypothetical protein
MAISGRAVVSLHLGGGAVTHCIQGLVINRNAVYNFYFDELDQIH